MVGNNKINFTNALSGLLATSNEALGMQIKAQVRQHPEVIRDMMSKMLAASENKAPVSLAA